MPECDSLMAGAGLIGIGLLLLYQSSRGNQDARMMARLALSRCGQAQEGMAKVSGRAVSAATTLSPVLGLPCLVSQVEVESYEGSGDKARWKLLHQGTEFTPFYVEDESGRVWVDPGIADVFLNTDVKYSTTKKWKPKAGHLVMFGEQEITAEMLEQRLRRYYEHYLCAQWGIQASGGNSQQSSEANIRRATQAAEQASRKKLRFKEKNLMPGDTVTVLGPAFAVLPGEPSAGAVRIHKIHPDDPFIIADGDPDEAAARMRKRVWWMRLGAFGCAAVGAGMIVSCFLDHAR